MWTYSVHFLCFCIRAIFRSHRNIESNNNGTFRYSFGYRVFQYCDAFVHNGKVNQRYQNKIFKHDKNEMNAIVQKRVEEKEIESTLAEVFRRIALQYHSKYMTHCK